MFQSCRGSGNQQKHENERIPSKLQRDNSNMSSLLVKLPTDADIMMIYASTKGTYKYVTSYTNIKLA